MYSRDELKQAHMREAIGANPVRFLLGDVRDPARLRRAAAGCDLVVHAAALKRVDACEYDPHEAVKTNIGGTANVIEACLDARVPKAILLSSDKAVHPINLYGATKLTAEKLWGAANNYAGTRFASVRYGNVIGSRGSVVEKWAQGGPVSLTDWKATRFWLPIEQAVELVLTAWRTMRGGETFVPKTAASPVADLLPAGRPVEVVGLGRGEKLHEQLVADDEVWRCYDRGDHYAITNSPELDDVHVGEGFRLVSGDAC